MKNLTLLLLTIITTFTRSASAQAPTPPSYESGPYTSHAVPAPIPPIPKYDSYYSYSTPTRIMIFDSAEFGNSAAKMTVGIDKWFKDRDGKIQVTEKFPPVVLGKALIVVIFYYEIVIEKK